MTPDEYFTPLNGQSLLIPGQKEEYRGQCVQSVGLWVAHLGLTFPAYLYAYLYYENGIPGYTKIPYGTDSPRTGDIPVWGPKFPDSPGAGHIDVVAQDGSWSDFWAWDSNWNPHLKLNKIHHTAGNQYIIGLLRRENDVFEGRSAEDWATQAKDAEQYKQGVVKSLAWKEIPGQPGGGMHEDPAYIRTEIDSLVQFKADTLANDNAKFAPYNGEALFVKKG